MQWIKWLNCCPMLHHHCQQANHLPVWTTEILFSTCCLSRLSPESNTVTPPTTSPPRKTCMVWGFHFFFSLISPRFVAAKPSRRVARSEHSAIPRSSSTPSPRSRPSTNHDDSKGALVSPRSRGGRESRHKSSRDKKSKKVRRPVRAAGDSRVAGAEWSSCQRR